MPELIRAAPMQASYWSAGRLDLQDRSDHRGRCARDLRLAIVKRRRDAFRRATTTWSQMKADAYKGALDQDKMTRASLPIGLFKDLGPPSNGRLIYGWRKTTNTVPGLN